MTADDWAAGADPQVMLAWLREQGKLSERKARLFAVACCRRIWPLLTDERSRTAVEVAERYADGLAHAEDLGDALGLAWRAYHGFEDRWVRAPKTAATATVRAGMTAAEAVGWVTADDDQRVPESVRETRSRIDLVLPVIGETARLSQQAWAIARPGGTTTEQTFQAALLRDIIGNPFHPPRPLSPSLLTWQDGLIVQLAEGIYENRSFTPDRLAVLADALEEAGLEDQEVLAHLRQSDTRHVRGCWALDVILGKE